MTAGNTFTCARCRQAYEKGLSEEEAVAEMHQKFGASLTPDDCCLVCDDCYNLMHPDRHPEITEESVAETLRAKMP